VLGPTEFNPHKFCARAVAQMEHGFHLRYLNSAVGEAVSFRASTLYIHMGTYCDGIVMVRVKPLEEEAPFGSNNHKRSINALPRKVSIQYIPYIQI
jgi:hypothetical protein